MILIKLRIGGGNRLEFIRNALQIIPRHHRVQFAIRQIRVDSIAHAPGTGDGAPLAIAAGMAMQVGRPSIGNCDVRPAR